MPITDLTGYTYVVTNIGTGNRTTGYVYAIAHKVNGGNIKSVVALDARSGGGGVSFDDWQNGDVIEFLSPGEETNKQDFITKLNACGTLTPPQPQNITLDLSTLSLRTGTHTIHIRLSDDGVTKRDSELSNAVTYVVAPQLPAPQNPVAITSDGTDFAFEPVDNAESYEILADGERIGECTPEPEPMGETWVINEEPDVPSYTTAITENINFISNGRSYSSIRIGAIDRFGTDYIFYNNAAVCSEDKAALIWTDEAYRTVYFPEPPTGDLRNWLNSNAELQ